MISAADLLLLKSRILLGADAARKIAGSPDPVFYQQEEYEAVYAALMSLKGDVARILAELDVLRGMFHSGVTMFLTQEASNGVPVIGGDVEPVAAPSPGGGGEGERTEPAGTDGRVPESGVRRKRAKRSKSRRDRGGNGGDPQPVGLTDGEG
jgi:hypothetical protein